MRRPRSFFLLCLCCLALLWPASVRATGLEDGDRLRDSGQLIEALRVYRSLLVSAPNASTKQRVAEVEERLGQLGVAYEEYAQLLDHYGQALTASQHNAIETRLNALSELTGLLDLECSPDGSMLSIDGRVVAKTPLPRPLRVTRGGRRLKLQHEGFRDHEAQLTISELRTRLVVTLQSLPKNRWFEIRGTTGVAAELFVDGRRIGPLPQRVELTPGEHELRAAGPAAESRSERLRITDSSPSTLALDLRPRLANIELEPGADDAILLLDGHPVAQGHYRGTLTPGPHELELRRPGFASQRLKLDAQPGADYPLRVGHWTPHATAPPPADAPPNSELHPNTAVGPGPRASKRDPFDDYYGIYGAVLAPIALGGPSTHQYNDDCPATALGGGCSTTGPKGGGLALRLGYAFGWFGVEALGGALVDVTTAELKLPAVPTINPKLLDLAGRGGYVRAGGLVGGGLRISTPLQGIRFTAGADLVYISRRVLLIPDSYAGTTLTYGTTAFMFDAGILLGETPGAKFYLGGFAWLESSPDLTVTRDLASLGVDPALVPASLQTVTLYRGKQFMYGPMIGIAFGH